MPPPSWLYAVRLEQLREPRVEEPTHVVIGRRVGVGREADVDQRGVTVEHVVDADGERGLAGRALDRVRAEQVELPPRVDLARHLAAVAVIQVALLVAADVAHRQTAAGAARMLPQAREVRLEPR